MRPKEGDRELVWFCRRSHPGHQVAGWRDRYFDASDHPSTVAEIAKRAPHILFVGKTSPFKESWCRRHCCAFGVSIIVGVSATVDVPTGYVRRASRPLQEAGMEWS